MIRDRSETNQRVIRDKVQVIRTDQRLIRELLRFSEREEAPSPLPTLTERRGS